MRLLAQSGMKKNGDARVTPVRWVWVWQWALQGGSSIEILAT